MRRTLTLTALLLLCASAHGRNVWTNTAGRAFTAELAALTDSHALFVMPGGATNRLALAALHPACQTTARKMFQLPEIPDVIRATFNLTAQELRRIRYQHQDGKIDAAAYADFHRRVLNGFRTMYTRHELPEENLAALEQRLLNASR
jgi:hypothetical protein